MLNCCSSSTDNQACNVWFLFINLHVFIIVSNKMVFTDEVLPETTVQNEDIAYTPTTSMSSSIAEAGM